MSRQNSPVAQSATHDSVLSSAELRTMRGRLADTGLAGLTFLAVPAFFLGIMMGVKEGWTPIPTLHAGAALILFCTLLFRRRIPEAYRAGVFFGFLVLIGATGLATHGVAGAGILYLFACTVFVTLFFGMRPGIAALLGALLLIALIGVGKQSGLIPSLRDVGEFVSSGRAWVMAMITFLLLVGTTVAVCGVLYRSLGDRILALRESQRTAAAAEERFRTIYDSINEAVFIHDATTGAILDVNVRACEMYGYDAEEFVTLQVECISVNAEPFTQAQAQEKMAKAAGGEPQLFEWHCRRRDGSAFWAEVYALPARISNQDRVLVTVRDATWRKSAEEALLLNETRMRSLLEMSQMTFETENEITDFALEHALKLTGSTLGYLAFASEDETILTMYSWSKSAMAECAIEAKPIEYPVANTGLWGEAIRQRKPIITNDYAGASACKKGYPEGHVQIARHMNIPLLDGERIVLVAGVGNKEEPYSEMDVHHLTLLMDGMWKNIKSWRAGKALRASEERFRSYIEGAPDGIFVVDRLGRFIDCNVAHCALAGYSREEILSKNVTDFLLPAWGDGMGVWYERMWTEGAAHEEIPLRRKDGEEITIELDAVRLNEDAAIGFCKDIRERKEIEAQLRQAQKMESVGRLAGGVAHDFNNMLQAILGNVFFALERTPEDSPVREDLMEIKVAAQRSADLTRQLLAFARKQTVNPKVIDLNVAVADTQKMLKRLIGENVELVWNPADYPCLVKIDVSQLDQILANLCVNARDAIRDVGGITLETGRQTVDDAYCAVHVGAVPGEYVVLTVSDSGYGMDPETLNQIFEPFFTTKGIGEGTGLGLATVYGILKQNNGFANVYSEPGHGTTFRIHLPVAEGDASPLTEASSPLSAISLDGAVLLVEDEPTILRIARRILEDNGCTVLAASTPEEALEIARSHDGPIPLLITDVVMPGMNGWELKERLGVIKSGLRCLYMSGYPADVIAHHGNLHEGVTLLEKPFTTNDFMAGISKVLGS